MIGVWSGSEFPTQETTIVLCKDGHGLYFYYHGSDGRATFVDEFRWTIGEKELNLFWPEHVIPLSETQGYDESQSEVDGDEWVLQRDYEVASSCWFTDNSKSRLVLAIDSDFAFAPMLNRLQSNPVYEHELARLKHLAANFNPFSSDRQVWLVSEGVWTKAVVAAGNTYEEYYPIAGVQRLPIVLGCLGLMLTDPVSPHQHHPDIIYVLAMLPPLGILANFKSEGAPLPMRRLFLSLAVWYCLMSIIIIMGNIAHHWQRAWQIPMALIAFGIYSCVLILAQEVLRHLSQLKKLLGAKQ